MIYVMEQITLLVVILMEWTTSSIKQLHCQRSKSWSLEATSSVSDLTG